HGEWSLLFSSEVRSILASGLIQRPRLDRRALASVLWNGFVTGPSTIVEGIESVRPGEFQVMNANGQTVSSRLYWTMPGAERKGQIDEDGLAEALSQSIKL